MSKLYSFLQGLARDERGQIEHLVEYALWHSAEYALLAGFIAVAAGAVLPGISADISIIFSNSAMATHRPTPQRRHCSSRLITIFGASSCSQPSSWCAKKNASVSASQHVILTGPFLFRCETNKRLKFLTGTVAQIYKSRWHLFFKWIATCESSVLRQRERRQDADLDRCLDLRAHRIVRTLGLEASL